MPVTSVSVIDQNTSVVSRPWASAASTGRDTEYSV